MSYRTDFLFEISQISQATVEIFNKNKSVSTHRLKKAAKFFTNYRIALKIPKLYKDSIRIVGFLMLPLGRTTAFCLIRPFLFYS